MTGGGAVVRRDLIQDAAARCSWAREAAMAERAVGDDGDAVILAPGLDGVLDCTLLQVVENLVAGDAPLAPGLPGGFEVGHIEVAYPPGQDLALFAEPLEAGESILKGCEPSQCNR